MCNRLTGQCRSRGATINKERIKDDNWPLLLPFENDMIHTYRVLKNDNYTDRRTSKQHVR